jgi:hypothetical protein
MEFDMSLKIEERPDGSADEVSLKVMNRKLENFVEIVLKKLVEQQTQIKDLKKRVKALEQA